MNEKQEFLRKLEQALVERDITKSDIDPYIERFDRYFERMQNDPDRSNFELLSDIDRIADNIANQIADRYERMNVLTEQTMTQKSVGDNSEAQIVFAPSDASDKSDEAVSLTVDEGSSDLPVQTTQYDSSLIERTMKPTEAEDAQPAEYIDEDEAPTGTLFWVLFAVSLPILIPLAAAGCAVFLAVWLALAALMIVSVLLLIAGSGAGAALSLVGIIYGITQIFISLPVGLYELGLGIMIGGGVMFAGIVLYNFAIRLIPLLMILLGRLFRFTCSRVKRLFIFLRRECARL